VVEICVSECVCGIIRAVVTMHTYKEERQRNIACSMHSKEEGGDV
jgi:hypothetical protein